MFETFQNERTKFRRNEIAHCHKKEPNFKLNAVIHKECFEKATSTEMKVSDIVKQVFSDNKLEPGKEYPGLPKVSIVLIITF